MLVCVGIPTIDGKVCAQTVDSLLAEQVLAQRQGVHLLVQWEIGCSLIGPARNKLARQFLDIPQAACLVFVDADISWKGGDLVRLAQRAEPVVGGTYRAKQEDERFHVRGTPEPVGDLYKVEGLPGGFLKIDRSAFEAIKPELYKESSGRVVADYFPTGMHGGRLWGEDYGFCRLWRETGGDVWLDPSIRLRHHDGTRAFDGDPKAWLERICDGIGK